MSRDLISRLLPRRCPQSTKSEDHLSVWGCRWQEDIKNGFCLKKNHFTTQIIKRFVSYRHFDRGNSGWSDRGSRSESGLVVFQVHSEHIFDSTQAPVPYVYNVLLTLRLVTQFNLRDVKRFRKYFEKRKCVHTIMYSNAFPIHVYVSDFELFHLKRFRNATEI